MKRIISLILSIVMVLALLTVPAFAENVTVTSGYDNLNNEAGDLVIGFLGGSITVADGDSNSLGFNRYAKRVTEWFQTKYPNKTVKQVNAGIGGTGSDLGKYRVMTDIGAANPDVVFVEYAVNDAIYSSLYSETVRSNMETIVRSLQSLPKVPVIVFLYSMHDNSYSNIKYTSIPDHEDVAKYYGIESINFYEYMSALVEKGDFIWSKGVAGSLTNDNIHPNALGHEQYGNYIISQLESRNILHKNNTGLARKFMFSTKDTRDIKFADADDMVKTGTWNDSTAGQSDNKYEAIQATATGDSVSFSYTSAGNDTLGVTVLNGTGTFVVDEGTPNEITGQITGSDNNLPVPKEFATELSAGKHTVKIVNTGDGETAKHLKLGRIIANGGIEVNAASIDANGDHIPGSLPLNRIISSQKPEFHSSANAANVTYNPYTGDYTSNGSFTVRIFSAAADTTAGGNFGCQGFNFARATAESNKGILFDDYTATAGTYVFKASVRALSGNPTIGATTVKNYKPSFDNEYGKAGFAPTEEWSDYKATLSPAEDGFLVAFGHLNSSAGDEFLFDIGDGVYFAPEAAYDMALTAEETTKIAIGNQAKFKAEILNQIGLPAKSIAQEFNWSVVDAEGNTTEDISVEDGVVTVGIDAPLGTYYVKAVSKAQNWQKTLAFEVIDGPIDPFARDHIPGEKPANLFLNPKVADIIAANTSATYITRASCSDWTSYYLKLIADVVATGTSYNKGLVGTMLLANNPADISYPEKLVTGKSYVYSFEAMNYGETDSFVYNMCLGTADGYYANYSVEHGKDGIVISDKENWVTVAGTMVMPGKTPGSNEKTSYLLSGFQDARVGSAIRVRHSAASHPYLAEEVPYDIIFAPELDGGVVTDVPAKFEAKLVNQIGSTGTLSQDVFTYSVFDENGESVEGLTVSADGTVLAVGDTVAEGTYYVRATAQIDETTQWNKTLAFDVTAALANTNDYVAGALNDNILNSNNPFKGQNSASVEWTGQNLPESVTFDKGTQYYTALKTKAEVNYTGYWGVEGVILADKETSANYKPEANTTYVYKARVRSVSGEQKINLTFSADWAASKTKYSNEYGREGKLIGTEWEDFKATVTTGNLGTSYAGGILFGLVESPTDDYLVINNSAGMYFAKEVAYDINVDGATDTISAGSSVRLNAEILNQIGTKGTLDQSFNWVAVTEDRMSYVDGISFVESNDGATVTVKVDENTVPGDYIIVAQNGTYGMNRHYPITVTEATYDVSDVILSVIDDSAILASLTVKTNSNVVVTVAAYDETGLIKSVADTLTPVDGVAQLEETLFLTALSSGTQVRLFVWSENLDPLTMPSGYRQAIKVQ